MRGFAKQFVLLALRGYKWALSPMFPPACRYVPTCSEYAMEAVERYGALRGAAMAVWRLMRCHPLARGGYDPVVRAGDKPKNGGACAANLTGEAPVATWLVPTTGVTAGSGFQGVLREQENLHIG